MDSFDVIRSWASDLRRPLGRPLTLRRRGLLAPSGFLNYREFWEQRYLSGGTSGPGSYGKHAAFKASVVNDVVARYRIERVIEFGCGDGNQLSHYSIPEYLGLDVAPRAIEMCRNQFRGDSSKSFELIAPGSNLNIKQADLVMCLEVLMHVTDEDDYLWTLENIFSLSSRLVVLLNPLFSYRKFHKKSHELYRDLFWYLVPFLDTFSLVNVILPPSVTAEDRIRRRLGEMGSDFIILERRGTN